MIPPPLRCIQRSAEASGTVRMDRSEDAHPVSQEDTVQVRDGGKPCVVQPPQRDKEKRGAPGSRRTANRRDEKTGRAQPSGIFRGAVSSVPSRRVCSVTGRSAEASGTARMDRSEDAHPVSQEDTVQVRDGGKPCVVQPPQRDKKKPGAPSAPRSLCAPLFCRILK